MDRHLLLVSTLCFLIGFGQTVYALRMRIFQKSGFSFLANLAGFCFQTAFLYVRGHQIGRCPLTNLFEILVFLCWSMLLFYLVIGPAYRVSLLGAFTAPLVFVVQTIALLLPDAPSAASSGPPAPWLELHAAVSVVAYGAFALACVAGVMYLAQERQLKTHRLGSVFFQLPPIHDLAVANSRLILAGFLLFTVGMVAGMMQGMAHIALLRYLSLGVWTLYGTILAATLLHRISPRRVAVLSVTAFSVMLLTLWGIEIARTSPTS